MDRKMAQKSGTSSAWLMREEEDGIEEEDVEGCGDDGMRRRERPKEPWKGKIVKSIVYAGLDAIVTCFSLISAISAGRLSSGDVLVLGFANLVADGISMGCGDYLSTSTEQDVAAKERAVAEWDVANRSRPEQVDLLCKYQRLGMSAEDAATDSSAIVVGSSLTRLAFDQVVNIFSQYKDIMVDEKMMAQKGMLPPDKEEKPRKNGLVTFVSFVVFGSAPLLSFIILIPFTNSNTVKFIGACMLSGLALVLLGIAKANIAGHCWSKLRPVRLCYRLKRCHSRCSCLCTRLDATKCSRRLRRMTKMFFE
ncbi:uncharacterized protein LOC115743035 [Rhodamnia argentea]|uniref:Uncharacterized protein LOC115743035 n=1 Tax=Rhodamnia argentea TaxID=178133 RepID=A0ABM3H6A2_9MYRT|nr:uncharacterized protein LOC115743035 [Rhodamnia argentea]